MKKLKKLQVMILISFVFAMLVSVNVFALSYPYAASKDYELIANVGSTVQIGYSYLGEYQNEELKIFVYDEDENEVYSDTKKFTSYYETGFQNVTFKWNTKGEASGRYKVVLHKWFYTYYEWHEAPTTDTCYVVLKEQPKTIKKGTTFISGKLEYKVTWVKGKKGTVTAKQLISSANSYLNIPATVKYKGITFKVTAIGKDACDFADLTKVVIGENVETIGPEAFYYCDKLKTIIIKSKKLKASKVGKKAFSKTDKNAAVRIPKSIYSKYVKFLKKSGFASTVKYVKG